jgi:HK97 family phage portal protein
MADRGTHRLTRLHAALAEPRFLRRTEDRALTRANVPAVMLNSAPGAASVTPSSALTIADAYACIRALADAAASLPLHVYRKTPEGRTRLEGRTAELLRRPAPATTTANLVGQLVAHLNLHGNAYVGKFRNADGQVEQLALLAPDRVTPELRGGLPLYTVSDDRGRQSVHGTGDIIHVRALSTDGLVGLSPVRQCRVALGLSAQLAEHAARFFDNDARPSGILKIPSIGSREQIQHVKAAWDAGHRGLTNAHRIAVVAGEASFESVSMPLEDAQFLGQRELSAQEVARIFRVPPWIVGAKDGGSMTYSNTEQQALHFATYSLRPWLVLIEQALSADADLFAANQYAEFVLDGLLRSDAATRADVYAKALDPVTGWMTRDEVRRLENLDPEPATRPVPTAH